MRDGQYGRRSPIALTQGPKRDPFPLLNSLHFSFFFYAVLMWLLKVRIPLRAVERVTLLRFLFGMHPY